MKENNNRLDKLKKILDECTLDSVNDSKLSIRSSFKKMIWFVKKEAFTAMVGTVCFFIIKVYFTK
ncbi:MAG: hypothetical protein K0S27_1029 [Gammaproteobacteria bacterium]|jgi:hypothetical protein|nr:hypothetical protein [Gammaproteobacteria bacterium]